MGLETAAIIAAVAAAAPALYGMGKDIFGPGTDNVDAAGAAKIQDMQKAAGAYGAYRPDHADARMKAMTQQLSAYQGAGNMMNAMYGGGSGGSTYTPGGGGYEKPKDGYSLPDGSRTPIDPRTGGPVPKNDYPINPLTGKPYTAEEWAQKRAFEEWQSAQQKNGTYGTGPIYGTPSGNPGGGGGPPIIVNPNPTSLVGPTDNMTAMLARGGN